MAALLPLVWAFQVDGEGGGCHPQASEEGVQGREGSSEAFLKMPLVFCFLIPTVVMRKPVTVNEIGVGVRILALGRGLTTVSGSRRFIGMQ